MISTKLKRVLDLDEGVLSLGDFSTFRKKKGFPQLDMNDNLDVCNNEFYG